MKHKKWIKPFIFTVFIITITSCWTIAYWVMNGLYHYIHSTPSPFTSQLITSLVGLLFFFGVVRILIHTQKHRKHQQMDFIQSIIDAIKQISRGDYNIHLQRGNRAHPGNPFDEIVDNMNDMASKLGEMEEMRQQFISNVSHEIQSPLTSISGFANELKSETLPAADRRYYLGIIETESKRLSNLSDNLLKLTYLESANNMFTMEIFRLDTQLKNAVLATEPQWTIKHITIHLDLDNISITADQALMNQVWTNLLNNAIKFTPENGHIHLTMSQNAEYVFISISDNGIGISNEEQLHLYERFYKADKARTNRSSGSGLGLSIVKRILDMHHAIIHVESKLQEGTTFNIKIRQHPPNN